jgi:hypothetical protein
LAFVRRRGARIRQINAAELLHRTVVNDRGAFFYVGGLASDAYTGTVWFHLLDVDEDDYPFRGSECGVASLEG